MSILSVDQIQPIGSGTTITLNATEVKTGTEITVGTGASIFSPAGNTLTLGTNNVERLRITNDGTFTVQTGGSERARIDSSGRLLIGLTASQTTDSNAHSKLQVATSAGPNIGLGNNSTDINNNGRLGIINFNSNHGGTYHEVGVIASRADADHASNSKPSRLEFYTTSSGNTQATERLRIDSGGRLLIGTTSSTAHTNAGNLQIGDYSAGGAGITINTTTSGSGNIYFGDSSSSNRRGRIEYDHNNDAFRHYTADSERFRIQSNGIALFGTTTPAPWTNRRLIVSELTSGAATCLELRSATNGTGRIYFTDGTSGGADSYAGKVWYDHADDSMKFSTGGGTSTPGTRMIIDPDGDLALQAKTQVRITLGNTGTHGTNSSNWIRGDGNNIMLNCANTSGDHIFEVAGTAKAKINGTVGVRAENTCKAWLSYRSEPGQEQIVDDFFVDYVTDEATGTIFIKLDADIGTEDGVAYIFGSHNDGSRPIQAVIGYTPSHGSYNPWWSMEDDGTRVNIMRADNNTKVDAEWISMAAFADAI